MASTKTSAKLKGRPSIIDVPAGPKNPGSTVLTIDEEAVIVGFRQHTSLPLDDCLYACSRPSELTCSSLHRCLQRHLISRLPAIEGDMSAKTKFKSYPIGFFHIDLAKLRTAEGRSTGPARSPSSSFIEKPSSGRRATSSDG